MTCIFYASINYFDQLKKSIHKPDISRCALLLIVISTALTACKPSTEGFDIDNHRGKWVVLNYWAEWCAPCIEEIPELNALSRNHPDQLVVLGVNFDRIIGEELESLVHRMRILYPNLPVDPASQLKLARPSGLPTTYLFSPDGELAAKLVGPQTENDILARIQRVSPEQPASAK